MTEPTWESLLADLSLEEIKKMIFSLTEQIFPVMEDSEKQAFILKLLGKSVDDKLSSMVSR